MWHCSCVRWANSNELRYPKRLADAITLAVFDSSCLQKYFKRRPAAFLCLRGNDTCACKSFAGRRCFRPGGHVKKSANQIFAFAHSSAALLRWSLASTLVRQFDVRYDGRYFNARTGPLLSAAFLISILHCTAAHGVLSTSYSPFAIVWSEYEFFLQVFFLTFPPFFDMLS